ncbi:uncharacterized protein LOC6596547 [Drosophila persimilis]|uniref:uncharacterized protein LOC6596547 n=1 Tax=Drosophila persimilis TaxID=7234 RepID=UPI000F08DF57|nr:uncharacterized protein LOC6596547 [Drosophila persimilis]
MSNSILTKDGFSRLSPYTQIAIGAGTGFVTGYVLLKASQTVAVVAGASILVAQLAIQAGVIKTSSVETIVPQRNQSNQGRAVRVLPTVPNPQSSEARMEQLTKVYEIVAGSSRLFVAMFGGFLVGFGLA